MADDHATGQSPPSPAPRPESALRPPAPSPPRDTGWLCWHAGSKPPSSGSTIIVVPRLLIKNPAMPNYRNTVVSAPPNASALNGWVSGARA